MPQFRKIQNLVVIAWPTAAHFRLFITGRCFYGWGMRAINIHTARPCDASIVVGLLRELARYENLEEKFCLTEEKVICDMMGDPCHCQIAFVDNSVAGIASWFWAYRSFRALPVVFIEDLYVSPQFRRLGVGRSLLAHLAAEAEAKNAHLEWQTLEWNKAAIDFYTSLGAVKAKEWLSYRLEVSAFKGLTQP